MVALQRKHGWGPSPAYILSGFLGVHPSYAQQLLASERYSTSEVTCILESVAHTGKGALFDPARLAEAISDRHRSGSVDAPSSPRQTLASSGLPWHEKPLLVIGRGPSAQTHSAAINEYISRTQPIVIECNHSQAINAANSHFCAFVVAANARAMSNEALRAGKSVIVPSRGTLGLRDDFCGAYVEQYQVRPGKLQIDDRTGMLILPSDVVSMLAMALGARCGTRCIEVVGFDGYADSANERERRMQEEMLEFFELLKAQGVAATSLTPTSYGIAESSIYGRLRS
jgi:hypothetical protein